MSGGALLLCLLTDLVVAAPASVTVTLDPTTKHQTIRGWSCNPHYIDGSKEQREQVIDEAVNCLGITRVRWQQPNGNRAEMTRWELENDNGDPDDTDLSKLNTADADKFVGAYVLPFKQRVEANDDPFELWLSPSFFNGGSTGSVPAFLLHSPGEYAEYAASFITYLRDKYGVETKHYAICNEAGNNNAFTPAVVAEFTKVLGERLEKLGLPTRGQFSDGINAQVTWRYVDHADRNLPDIWKYVDVLSYHWYGGKNHEYMPKIRDFARQHGMDTAQSEYMHLKVDHLYDDLTLGGVSYWSIYGLGGPGPRGQNFWLRPDGTSFRRGRQFWNFRQVMHYVRPGAVRIEAKSSDPALRVLAFAGTRHLGRTYVAITGALPIVPELFKRATDSSTVVALISTKPPQRARSVTIIKLPAGKYGTCRCVNGQPYEELGVRTVGADGKLMVDVPANTVLTVYPHPVGNLPPSATNWEAQPTFLKAPASKVKLSAAAQDPELDQLSYSWSVAKQPAGANVAFTNAKAATTQATGMTVPGRYAFTVTISDGTSEVKRHVLLNVLEGNQPPKLIDVHNRIPVLVTLPQSETLLRGGAFDLEGDKLAFTWSVVKQPAGSDVKIETDEKGRQKLINITRPGDHVLRFECSDGTHAVSQELTIPVFPPNQAPVVESLSATPANVKPPAEATRLTSKTSDPDNDTLSHWWRVKSAPAGAEPVFEKQGGRETKVSGLSAPGTYLFELTVVDETKFTKGVVRVTVGAAAPQIGLTDPPAPTTKDDRVITHRGTAVGTVVGKGRAWIEVRTASGKTARYLPEWRGGAPRNGGGPDKQVVAAIARLKVGDTVTVKWYVNDHVRIESISSAP